MTLTGIPVVDVLVIIAVGFTAPGVIFKVIQRVFWRNFLRPIIRAAQKVNDTLPVLVDIAEEFRPNSGGSLHDIITALSDTTKKMAADGEVLSSYAHGAKHDTIDKIATLQGWQNHHGEKLDGFIQETKTRFEELGAEVTAVQTDVATVMTIIDRRGETR